MPQKQYNSDFSYLNEYDHMFFENEKFFKAGHGGKQRNKREIELNSNKNDPCGHVRKITAKLSNSEHNKRSKAVSK